VNIITFRFELGISLADFCFWKPVSQRLARVAAVVTTICLVLLSAISAQSQCDWPKKIAFAIQRRYQTNENACKALVAPPDELNRAHALIENEYLSQFQFVTDPRLDEWLQQHSQQMLSQLNSGSMQQTVRVAAIPVPNAFATGQNVTFHAGLVQWYLAPQNVLTELGYSQQQIDEFLAQYGSLNPGENGLIGILAHETSHNILGHADVRPLVLACDDFINAGIREVHNFEQMISTGHPASRFGAFFRSAGFLASETMFGAQRQQEMESEADELGAWLAYRDTGDPAEMSKSLQWLAMYPGAADAGGFSEALCSDHPQLLNRVNNTAALASSVQGGPSQHLLQSPVTPTKQRYQQFQKWYPERIEQIQRIAAGNLTSSEAGLTRAVEIEVKPKAATATLDGQAISSGKSKLQLKLGPHLLSATAGNRQREYRFVVLNEGPDKFKLEIK
jgi:predicted Zn-dependent protease